MKIEGRSRIILRWVLWGALVSILVLLVVADVVLRRAEPILKGRVVQTLAERFDSRVELDRLQVSILHGLQVSGSGLRIYPPEDMVAAGAKDPLLAVQDFEFHAALIGLFVKPMHVDTVHVHGLTIHIPPREVRAQQATGSSDAKRKKRRPKIKIEVGEFVFDDSQVVIGTAKPNKDPKVFTLKHIVLRDVGPDSPWPYDATLTNAIPKGDIHAVGSFGPWVVESPGDSNVNGRYTFDHADLNTIKGIGGMLSSVGEFNGKFNRIEAHGTAKVPNFSLDTANHPVPLFTKFSVIVDGTSGDTYLQPVQAVLGTSAFTCSGKVVNVKGKGHVIDLDVNVPAGELKDFLALSVKTEPVVMTATMQMRAHIHIPPGKVSVSQKMSLAGETHLDGIQFTRQALQSKVNMLSERAKGQPGMANANAAVVNGQMSGKFKMDHGELNFPGLHYSIPGAEINLQGVYSLDGKKFDFFGKVRTQAKLSQMVSSWWKSLLLSPADPFFAKHGAGMEIPVKITGTNSDPKFGLDFGRDKSPPGHTGGQNTPSRQPGKGRQGR